MITAAPEFYQTGGTLRPGAPCYVERQADAQLHEALLRGEFTYVLTSRQMGKSSLMARTAARLRQEGVAVALLDLTFLGQNLSPEQWYAGLLEKLGVQLDLEVELEDYWHSDQQHSPLQRWLGALQRVVLPQVPGRVVLFIDEIDAVRSLPFSTDEFFAAIRACYNRRSEEPEWERLTFCLLGVATPSDLIADVRTTPFNIGKRIELTDFTEVEAAPLAHGLGRAAPVAQSLLRRVLYWTGGHPYLTQRLCQAVAESQNVDDVSGVDQLCGELFLAHGAAERDDNLLFVRERLLASDVDLAGLLELYRRVWRRQTVRDEETSRLVGVLRLAGVARVTDGRLVVGNRIYERVFDGRWVTEHMPDAEVQRQRAAYLRGVLRTASAAAVVVAVVLGLAVWAVTEKGAARAALRREQGERARADANTRQAREVAKQNEALAHENEGARAKAERNADLAALKAVALREALGQRDQAVREEERQAGLARASAGRATREAQRATQEKTRAQSAFRREELLRRQAEGASRSLYIADMSQIQSDWQDANIGRIRALLEETRNYSGRGFEWYYWNRLSHQDLLTLSGHTGHVTEASFSSDGKRILTGAGDSTGKVWDAESGRQLLTFRGHAGRVNTASFSPDGHYIVTGSDDNTAKVWDATTAGEIRTLKGHGAGVTSAGFSPDGRRIVTGSYDRTAKLWDAATGHGILTLRGHQAEVTSARFSPDGRRIVTGSGDRTARVWDAASGQETLTLTGHANRVTAASFSPDGRQIVTASEDYTAKLWDAASGRELHTLQGHSLWVYAASFSPDGRQIVTGSSDRTVKVWDAASGREIVTLKGHADRVNSAKFSPDGQYIVTGSWDGAVKVWNAASGWEVPILNGHTLGVNSASFSPDRRRIVTGSDDRTAKVWDAASGRELLTLQGHTSNVNSAGFSPNGRQIVTGSSDGTAKVWNATTGQVMLTLKGHTANVTSARFSPDGRRIVTGSDDHTARVWDAASGRGILILRGHTDGIRSASFSADGRRIVTGSLDCTAKVWDTASGRELHTLQGHTGRVLSASFSPDGQQIVTGNDDNTAKVWNAVSGRATLTLNGHRIWVNSVGFSPDGHRIVTGSADGTAKVWDAASGRELLTLHGANLASFSSDGHRIVTGSIDGTARIWNGSPVEEAVACTHHLKIIWQAVTAYLREKGKLPARLSDLYPRYLPDAGTLHCPADPSSGEPGLDGVEPDLNLPTSYIYEFNADGRPRGDPLGPDPPGGWRSWRQLKEAQRTNFGDRVPMVRCWHHPLVLSLTASGQVYRGSTGWEYDAATVPFVLDCLERDLAAGLSQFHSHWRLDRLVDYLRRVPRGAQPSARGGAIADQLAAFLRSDPSVRASDIQEATTALRELAGTAP